MRNLKIGYKLMISFSIMILLLVIASIISIVVMGDINDSVKELYDYGLTPVSQASKILDNIQQQRINIYRGVIFDAESEDFKNTLSDQDAYEQELSKMFDDYEDMLQTEEERLALKEIRRIYEDEFVVGVHNLLDYGSMNDQEGALAALGAVRDVSNALKEAIDAQLGESVAHAEDLLENSEGVFGLGRNTTIIVSFISLAIGMFFMFYIRILIRKPIEAMKNVCSKIADTGDMEFTKAEKAVNEDIIKYRDEISESMRALLKMISHFTQLSEVIKEVSEGDLTVKTPVLSERDVIGQSVARMVDNLNNMFGEIGMATDQVSMGSRQIASGAQSLAQGAVQQSASIDELSSTIGAIAEKANENEKMATSADVLAKTIMKNANSGSMQMNNLAEAVEGINEASNHIAKIIKVIDDIAFQTNILALNAAVEAARAGEAGRGFTVVAEEVRNLAAKSADAAKDINSIVEDSIKKAALGRELTKKTLESLNDIVSGIQESSTIISDIADSSQQQSAAISQINEGIDQVAKVVQQNSATAEESAAASEEMNGQADMLKELTDKFKIK